MEIELIPGLLDPNLKLRLETLFVTCKSFRGCVAFWTIKTNFFREKAFVQALKKENSFFCCDIQLPTNIDNILEYYKEGVKEIYLHKYRQPPEDYTQNTNLLHSKVLLFELDDTHAEIWVGSHNFTGYAIEGLNLEAAISIKCTIYDKIYKDILSYLEYIKRDFCFQFDASKVDIYKKLQTRDAEKTDIDSKLASDIKKVVTLVGYNMDTLVQEQIIQLLSLNYKQYAQFKTTGEELYLHTYDIGKRKEFLYKCRIEQTGKLDKAIDKLELDFTKPRRFAYIGTGKLALLKNQIKVDNKILAVSKYFVNIAIVYEIIGFEVLEKPPREDFSFWRTQNINPYNERINSEHSEFEASIVFWHTEISNRQKQNRTKKRNVYKIQEAVLDRDVQYESVNLTRDWQIFQLGLEEFYSNLDKLILQEHKIIQDINSKQANELLEKFLEEARKDKNLSQYSKSQIDRIIKELNEGDKKDM